MAILHVRNVPEKLYGRIRRLAAEERSSLSAEVIRLLDTAVAGREQRREVASLLAGIRRRRIKLPAGAPSTLTLLREDRNR